MVDEKPEEVSSHLHKTKNSLASIQKLAVSAMTAFGLYKLYKALTWGESWDTKSNGDTEFQDISFTEVTESLFYLIIKKLLLYWLV